MESFILIAVSFLALYYLSQKQDQMADRMIGEQFIGFERIYNNVTYSCHDSTVVRKQINSAMPVPLIPSTSYYARALCVTEDSHWFWFDASIRKMKPDRISITPTSDEEAYQALKDDPEMLRRYFPDSDKQSA